MENWRFGDDEFAVTPEWFAASLVFCVLNEAGGLWRRTTSVVLIRAVDFGEAFVRACEIGREEETSYANPFGERVRWAFERVATLDRLPPDLVDGVEVYSEPGPVVDDASVAFDVQFDPDGVEPGQSGVWPE